ncbi:MAG: carbon monoxide dehydrogenase [Candidatus Aenigmarchaeota archaeon]|nr:carbon monoxide dehydrogenase [Candidatus Aenigmarchaeota archaeon]
MGKKERIKRIMHIAHRDEVPQSKISYKERLKQQQPQCIFGSAGGCCKICSAGPCRLTEGRFAHGKFSKGVCGASMDVVTARNFLRSVAAGVSAHADHARIVAEALGTHKVKNGRLLKKLMKKYKAKDQKELSKKILSEFAEYDFKVSRALHQTNFGVNADPGSYLERILELGAVDYRVMEIASSLQSALFGAPHLVKCESNLGVLKKDYVNIVVHGHVPLLAEKIIEYSNKLTPLARRNGAKGINIVGMCCDAHELARHGIPMAGHLLQQEFAIMTGAVDAMVVDLQCIFPSLKDLAECYHIKLITTYDIGKIHGAMHVPFSKNPDKVAEKIINEALVAYKNRSHSNVNIPADKSELYAGFSIDGIESTIGVGELAKKIKSGQILGIAAIVGCRNPKIDGMHEKLAKSLIHKNILVLATGCASHAIAQSGLMIRNKSTGKKLSSAIGELPPCFHMGACVDNSQIFRLFEVLAKKMNIRPNELPVVFCAPEWVTEKALAIGSASLAGGYATYVNPKPPLSKKIIKHLERGLPNGGFLITGRNHRIASIKIARAIKKKRKHL